MNTLRLGGFRSFLKHKYNGCSQYDFLIKQFKNDCDHPKAMPEQSNLKKLSYLIRLSFLFCFETYKSIKS